MEEVLEGPIPGECEKGYSTAGVHLARLPSGALLLLHLLYSFFDKVSRAALHLGINLADIYARDAHTRGDDATDKPHGDEQGSPTLNGLALEMFYQGKDNHDNCYQGHRQT